MIPRAKKLKSIITGKYLDDCGNGIISTEVSEQVAPGRVEYVKLYFDENGRISKEDARWRMQLSEGLAPYQDEKTGKYGYVGEDGTWVIAPTFDFARDFKGRLCRCFQKSNACKWQRGCAMGHDLPPHLKTA